MITATRHKKGCGCSSDSVVVLTAGERLQANAVIAGRVDPTRTLTIRNAFARDMAKRFRELRGVIRKAVIEDDCFGLAADPSGLSFSVFGLMTSPGHHAFAFGTSSEKVAGFMDWMNRQVENGILEVSKATQLGTAVDNAWTNTYIKQSYARGVERGRKELIKAGYKAQTITESGGIAGTMNAPLHADTLGLMYTRTFQGLKGITAAMDLQISSVLTQGLADGVGPIEMARNLTRTISGPSTLAITDTLGRYIPAERRAKMLARTEVVRAHHLATMNEYENYGLANVKVKAEWATAGFNVCPECSDLEGEIFGLKEMRSMIPLHPYCRCIALPITAEQEAELKKSQIIDTPKKARTAKAKAKKAPKPTPTAPAAEPVAPAVAEDPVVARLQTQDLKDKYIKIKKGYDKWFDQFTKAELRSAKWANPIEGVGPKNDVAFKVIQKSWRVYEGNPLNLARKKVNKAFDRIFSWQGDTLDISPQTMKLAANKYEGVGKMRYSKEFGANKVKAFGIMPEDQYLKVRAFNQAYMDAAGYNKETLYRGLDGGSGEVMVDALAKNKAAQGAAKVKVWAVEEAPLAGWTNKIKIAEKFGTDQGGVVIKHIFAQEEVFLHRNLFGRSTYRFSEEAEYIVFGGKREIAIKEIKWK